TLNWTQSFSGPIIKSMLYYQDNLYLVVQESTPTSSAMLYSVSVSTGDFKKMIPLQERDLSDPTVAKGKLFIADGERLKCVYLQSSQLLWEKEIALNLDLRPVIQGNQIVVVQKDNKLSLLDTDSGKEYWQLILNDELLQSPIIYKDMIVLSQKKDKQIKTTPYFQGISLKDGHQLWEYYVSGPYQTIPVSPGISQGIFYSIVGIGDEHSLVALDLQTGAQAWQYSLMPASSFEGRVSIDEDRGIYVMRDNKEGEPLLDILDLKTGRLKESLKLQTVLGELNSASVHYMQPYKSYLYLQLTKGPSSIFAIK
ncbi:hypothetical protein DID77_00645, partial [Candidatus Marinamargulisbacteria bacterium SCGC AG-439-L15]